MITGNNGAAQALFKSISDDGTCWLFVVLSDGRWEITRDGKRDAAGTGDRASIDLGVEKFLSLTTAVLGPVPSDAAIRLETARA